MAATKSFMQHYDKSLYSLSEHNQCVTKIAKSRGTAYGSNITPQHFVHHWQLKILQFHNPQSQMFIGIHDAKMKQLKQATMSKSIAYGYGSAGKKFNSKGKTKKFGSKYLVGDVVHVVLDLTKGTIAFGVNESPLQQAYTIKDVLNFDYCLAIFLPSVDDAVTLLSYQVSEANIKKISPVSQEKLNDESTKEDDAEHDDDIPSFVRHMNMHDVMELSVNDKIDHRDQMGRFVVATVSEKQGSKLRIHYDGWSCKWDTWSDFSTELPRFAVAGSISLRPSHRAEFRGLEKGDYVDINPSKRHFGWKVGKIRRLDAKSGQVQVVYEYLDKNYLYWAHLDDEDGIASFASESGKKPKEVVPQVQAKAAAEVDEMEAWNRIRPKLFPRYANEEICNKYRIGESLQVQDTKTLQWIDATVIDKENNWICVHFDGWPSKYDQKIHVIKHARRLLPLQLGAGLEEPNIKNDSDDMVEDKPKPKLNQKRCPHLNRIKKKINRFKKIQCHTCPGSGDMDDRLEFCLTCFKVNCGRNSKYAHGLNHYINNTKHNLCMMLPSYDELNEYPKNVILDEMLPIWCYKCDVFLHETEQSHSSKLDRIRSEVYGCLQRGNKRISRTQAQQQNKSKDTHNAARPESMSQPNNNGNQPLVEHDADPFNYVEANALDDVRLGIANPHPMDDQKLPDFAARVRDKQATVKSWLTREVELPQYIDLFLEEGYDEMDIIVKTVTEQDLLEIGIKKRGHRKKILLFIDQLKNESNNNASNEIAAPAYGWSYEEQEGIDNLGIVTPNIEDTAR